MKNVLRFLALILIILVAGCASPSKKQQPQQAAPDESQIMIDAGLAERARETAKTVKGVEDSTAVAVNKEITAALKVSGFDRLRLKKIKMNAHDQIKELNKDYNVFVTTDKKLFVQLQQLEREINGPQHKSPKEILERFNKINKDIQK